MHGDSGLNFEVSNILDPLWKYICDKKNEKTTLNIVIDVGQYKGQNPMNRSLCSIGLNNFIGLNMPTRAKGSIRSKKVVLLVLIVCRFNL